MLVVWLVARVRWLRLGMTKDLDVKDDERPKDSCPAGDLLAYFDTQWVILP